MLNGGNTWSNNQYYMADVGDRFQWDGADNFAKFEAATGETGSISQSYPTPAVGGPSRAPIRPTAIPVLGRELATPVLAQAPVIQVPGRAPATTMAPGLARALGIPAQAQSRDQVPAALALALALAQGQATAMAPGLARAPATPVHRRRRIWCSAAVVEATT